MKKILMIITSITAIMFLASCERIDAGHEGLKVNLVGSSRGVDDVALVTGWIFYNPMTTRVYEYATFVQTVDYEPFTINAKDGAAFVVDPTISLKVIDGQSPSVFRKYRKPLDEIINVTLYNYVKDAFRVQLNKFTTDELISQRSEFERNLEESLTKTLNDEGFNLVQLTSGLQYPESIVQSVNRKTQIEQEAMRAENELRVAEAEAKKKIVMAEAEKRVNDLKTQSLSPLIIQQMWIEKWNGVMPKIMANDKGGLIISGSDLK